MKPMRLIVLTFFSIFLLSEAIAQDKIFLVNGNEVIVNITGSDDNFVLAKSTNTADQKIYKYPKTEIDRVEFQDGRVEYFEEQALETAPPEKFVETMKPQAEIKEELVQEERKHHSSFKIGLITGLNSPLGRYAGTSSYDEGFAKMGNFVNLELSFMYPSFVGMGLNIGYATNGLKEQSVEHKWELPYLNNYSATTTKYSHFYIMLGPQFSIKAEENLFIDVKLRYGLSVTQEPKYEVKYSNDSSGFPTKVNNISDSTNSTSTSLFPFSFNAGIALRYHINKHLGVSLGMDYMLIPYYFDSAKNIETTLPNGTTQRKSTSIEIVELASMAHIGIGVYFLIGN